MATGVKITGDSNSLRGQPSTATPATAFRTGSRTDQEQQGQPERPTASPTLPGNNYTGN
jgi:hypothetical protein